jgi:Na+-transporting NADH:ubiquinone oxidoreductase subunit C
MSSKGSEAIKTITVAGVLCLVCSLLVSVTVMTLKPMQVKNKELDMKKNILMSAGLIKEGDDVEAAFSAIETIVIDFETGLKTDAVEAKSYDENKAAATTDLGVKIPSNLDVGGISTRGKYATVYLTRDESGAVKDLILPVKGKGLWSTMYGFIALASDTKTIKGFAYYAQGETPGLGGEVDNPNWKKQWVGKKLFDDEWNVAFEVAKGTVDHTHGLAQYKVDGLSGATITANGVTSSMKYWFGEHGYSKFLAAVRAGEI